MTVTQVYGLADAIGQRYRALVLLAAFGSLRWGALAALRRCDMTLRTRTVRVIRQFIEPRGGFEFGSSKSDAGRHDASVTHEPKKGRPV